MTENPVVTVLYADTKPDEDLLAPVSEQATLRYTDAAGLADALPGTQVLFAYDFLTYALPEHWSASGSLEWIHIASAGVERFIFPELRDSNVTVTNSRGIFDSTIAEYVLGQIISFAKDFPGSWQFQQQHEWKHRDSLRVSGSKALVVGTGPIGRAVARLLRAAGMEVAGSGRRAREGDPD